MCVSRWPGVFSNAESIFRIQIMEFKIVKVIIFPGVREFVMRVLSPSIQAIKTVFLSSGCLPTTIALTIWQVTSSTELATISKNYVYSAQALGYFFLLNNSFSPIKIANSKRKSGWKIITVISNYKLEVYNESWNLTSSKMVRRIAINFRFNASNNRV